MKSTQYLYDINPTELESMNYVDAINHRIVKAKILLTKLMDKPYYTRDDERVNAVFKAIRFNEELLKELSC